MKYVVIMMVAVIAITGCFSCGSDKEQPAPSVKTPEPTEVIGDDLMISLLQAKNFHRKARVLMSDGKIDEAIASVRQILSLEFPKNTPEAEDVRNDARALLAKLLVGQGKVEDAMNVVTEGIAQSQRESFFVANLYTVKGEIHEARAAQLDANDPANKPKIIDEKRAAIEAYDKSNQINTVLQQRLMEER
jgi:tetratricopeptide (TPR) repeat protein